ncbi:MAG: peptidoglycan-binding protein [Cellulosilyticaceae bacterium]
MAKPFYPPIMSRQSFGTLLVEVTSDALLGPMKPLSQIPITISERLADGSEKVIAEMLTNDVGQTPPIELAAPPEEYSLSPTVTATPFASYFVKATDPSFVPTAVIGSQIFSTITSIQPIQLIPTQIMQRRLMRQEINTFIIGLPTLYGDFPPKIPEAEIKPILPGSNFITLDDVVVPEYIIVHDGSPNDLNATNYTIPYKDYIKNVASSEIYPTWPKETLASNIIAIVSFTLNRVFTEWYRNKGKPFTITNSTAYDHAFFNGRNIFDSISQVVDEYFNVYVSRPGVEQPLLTQYCDGRRVQCPNWLSQWGSQALGDDGVIAPEIIRYYYGQEVNLKEAPKVQGIPESYPGRPLKIGDSGPSVRKIQEQLNRIAQNYPKIPKIKTDAEFDAATQAAIKIFQEIFHLPTDGIIGKNTWYKISEIYVAVTRMAELL